MEAGVEVFVPAVVLAETVRGRANDAPVNQVIKAVGRVLSVNETTGRLAGRLLREANSAETVDALVVASTIEAGGGILLTGDPADIRPLAERNPEVQVQSL